MRTLFETPSFSISTTVGKNTPKIDGVFFCNIKEKVLGKGYELSLVFVGANRMRTLNNKHRNKDYATDILSFGLVGGGEIFINPDKARSKAKEFGRSFENYIQFLFVHGLVHLKGYDHDDDVGAEKMEKVEVKIRKVFNI